MINYLLRRVVYGILILLGVNLITFVLFFAVNTPDDMARLNLGGRRVTADAIEAWKAARGLDKPLFINTAAEGVQKITDTVFFERSVPLLFFDFGRSDSGRDIGYEISTRMWPSLALAVPTFLLGLIVMVAWSLLVVLFRRTRVEAAAIGLSVFLMSISSLFYIIVGQWLFSKLMRLFPISGWADGWGCTAFLVLPVLIALFSRLGSDTLLYRAMFLEEIGRDYVRTARAKGLSEGAVLRRHVLRNAALPIITSSVAVIPMLFMGSLIMESFFGIPGLGSYTIDALGAQDFSVVRTMVFLGTFAYIIGLIATDIVYAWVDPRIRLEGSLRTRQNTAQFVMLPVFLPTDFVAWGLFVLLILAVRHVRRSPELARRWRMVFARPSAAASAAVLAIFLLTALMDSIHWRDALPPADASDAASAVQAYSPEVKSLLDVVILERLKAAGDERSYSMPFALREFDKTTVFKDGHAVRDFQPLKNAGKLFGHRTRTFELVKGTLIAAIAGGVTAFLAWIFTALAIARRRNATFTQTLMVMRNRDGRFPWRPAMLVFTVAWLLMVWLILIWPNWHVFGTDAVGNDVLYEAVKSVRTAVVIGSLATLATLPFALTLGIAAGYFRGWVDDVIQYVYTTISSIPSVLLIAASVLMVQVFLDKHPELYQTSLERADLRLMLLAVIIGMTGWATLARLLRAETMKLSTLDFVSAAKALGVKPFAVMRRHILPNVMHIVLIVTVLDFSGIVLYEAVLSYVGVGVDPTMHSFGTMINSARSELSRSPMIWWNLLASFLFLVTLVLSANIFASAVRDAFDPRAAGRGRA